MNADRFATSSADLRRDGARAPLGVARELIRHGALSVLGGLARERSAPSLCSVYLHSVYDDQVHGFRMLLERLLAIGPFVSTEALVEMVRGQRPIDRPCFHLSFDDGFDNNYRNAFPVLESLGIKATFFVPSRLVGASDSFIAAHWWNKDPLPTRTMSWRDVREMRDAGHEIGSHTRTHARLSAVSAQPERLQEEIAGSKADVEDALGEACKYIAWPFGTAADMDSRAFEAVERAGYEACFSAVRGEIEVAKSSLMNLPRHHFEPDWPWWHLRYFALGGRG